MSVITKDFVVKSGIEVRGTAAVTTTTAATAGGMFVGSGLAVNKNLLVGGNTTLYGSTTTDALTVVRQATMENVSAQRFTATNILSNGPLEVSGTYTVTVGTGKTTLGGQLQVDGTTQFNENVEITGNKTFTVGTGTTTLNGALDVSGHSTISSLTATSAAFSGAVAITDSTQAVSTSNAALTVIGGAGIGGNLYVGGEIVAQKLTIELTTVTTTQIVTDDVIFTQNSTDAISTDTGAITAVGGLGIGKSIFIGDKATIQGLTTITNTTNAATTQSGALRVAGGVGIGQDLRVGGEIYGNVTGDLTGTADSADNLTGGAAGAIPYQSNTGTTTFVNIGNNGYVLTSNGSAPTWQAISGLSAGNATTATNIAGGDANLIPYQLSTGNTTFNGNLQFNGSQFTTIKVAITGTDVSSNVDSGALTVDGGVGINGDVYIGQTLNVTGQTNLGAVNAGLTTATSLNVVGQSTFAGVGAGATTATSLDVTGLVTSGITQAQTTGTVVPALFSNVVLLSSYKSIVLTGTGTANLDSFASNTYRSAKYYVQVYDSPNVHVTEISMFHDDTDAFIIEYGTGSSAGDLGTFSATFSAGTVTLTFTPNPSATAMTIKLVRLALTP